MAKHSLWLAVGYGFLSLRTPLVAGRKNCIVSVKQCAIMVEGWGIVRGDCKMQHIFVTALPDGHAYKAQANEVGFHTVPLSVLP